MLLGIAVDYLLEGFPAFYGCELVVMATPWNIDLGGASPGLRHTTTNDEMDFFGVDPTSLGLEEFGSETIERYVNGVQSVVYVTRRRGGFAGSYW